MEATELRTKVFEALGEASMQWYPKPAGVFDSSACQAIGEKLWGAIEAELPRKGRHIEAFATESLGSKDAG